MPPAPPLRPESVSANSSGRLEPLTPSMRTSSKSVGEGRWGRSRVAGGLLAPFQVARVAVLDCCTQLLHALLHSLPRSLGEPGSEAALGPPVGDCLEQRTDQGVVSGCRASATV
jgi:hypothetical protein